MSLKAVIFDVGGVLIYYPHLKEIKKVCENHYREIGLDKEILLQMYEFYMAEREKSFQTLKEVDIASALSWALASSGISLSQADFKKVLWKIHYFQNVKSAKRYKGVIKVLRRTKDLNLKLGLISNTPFPGQFHEQDLRRFGLSEYFDVKIWSSEFGFRKPNSAVFLKALSDLGVTPQEAIFIGDRFDRDVKGPNEIGMRAIWITQKEKQDFSGWQVKEIKEVINIIQDLKDTERLLEIVKENILYGEFISSAGKKISYYFDGRLVTLSAEGAYLVGKKVFELITAAKAEAIGGPTLGADPIIGAVIAISHLKGKPISGFIVRKEAKTHGTQKLIEGNLPRGGKVAIFDDVITTGGSIFRAIEAVEAEGCQVVKVVVLLDRQEGGAEELRKRGYNFTAIFSINNSGEVVISSSI